jgi:transposase
LDLVEGRAGQGSKEWLQRRSPAWRAAITHGTLDLSSAYKAVFTSELPEVTLVADPFHVVKLATSKLDETRRRVQNETLGHRGHKDDPLYRLRRLLTKAEERLSEDGKTKLLSLLEAGDPNGEVATAWHAKEAVRELYSHQDQELALQWLDELAADLSDTIRPPEVRTLGRTLKRWRLEITAWHACHFSNGPTEAMNNLIKRVKRVAFGFTSFRNYRIRSLLYAGKPNWSLLESITPR